MSKEIRKFIVIKTFFSIKNQSYEKSENEVLITSF